MVGCRMLEVDSHGTELVPRTSFAIGDVNDVLVRFNPIPNSCAMVRRRAALEIGGFDPRYRYAMDYDLWLRLADEHVVATTRSGACRPAHVWPLNVAARNERAQTAETIGIRVAALRRRRTVQGRARLTVPLLSS